MGAISRGGAYYLRLPRRTVLTVFEQLTHPTLPTPRTHTRAPPALHPATPPHPHRNLSPMIPVYAPMAATVPTTNMTCQRGGSGGAGTRLVVVSCLSHS